MLVSNINTSIIKKLLVSCCFFCIDYLGAVATGLTKPAPFSLEKRLQWMFCQPLDHLSLPLEKVWSKSIDFRFQVGSRTQ